MCRADWHSHPCGITNKFHPPPQTTQHRLRSRLAFGWGGGHDTRTNKVEIMSRVMETAGTSKTLHQCPFYYNQHLAIKTLANHHRFLLRVDVGKSETTNSDIKNFPYVKFHNISLNASACCVAYGLNSGTSRLSKVLPFRSPNTANQRSTAPRHLHQGNDSIIKKKEVAFDFHLAPRRAFHDFTQLSSNGPPQPSYPLSILHEGP